LKAIIADRVFTGNNWLDGHAVLLKNETIADVIPVSELPADILTDKYDSCILAPAFIDLQVYGAQKKLFASFPETDALYKLSSECSENGTAYCLPTVATNTKEVFYRAIDAIRKYWDEGGRGILGLHIEGPWISKEKRGAHIGSIIHAPTFAEVEEMMIYGKDVIKMITLAPEVCSNEVIDCILSHNVVISAGHSNAGYDDAMHGFEKGITAVTHLYNAMSGLNHRQPGLVGATFENIKVMASIIPDGHHVDFAAVRIAKKIMGERLFAITDAVTETTEGYYQHQFAGDKYEAGGILSGSALSMNKAFTNLVQFAGIEIGEALRMCSLYPAKVLRMENELGRIQKGFPGNIVVLDESLDCIRLIS